MCQHMIDSYTQQDRKAEEILVSVLERAKRIEIRLHRNRERMIFMKQYSRSEDVRENEKPLFKRADFLSAVIEGFQEGKT